MKRIIIIGGGPGGYVAAIKAAQSGAETHLIEAGRLGGTCLNIGCIPTKSLLHSAFFYNDLINKRVAGINAENITIDWGAIQKHKTEVTERLVNGVKGLLSANKVTVHNGVATFAAPDAVTVNGEVLPKSDAIIIATGSQPVRLNFPGADLPQVIDSTKALSLDQIPRSISIIGGGVIGVEFASIFSSLNCKATIIEMMPEILPPIDVQIARILRAKLEKDGIDVLTGAKLCAVKKNENGGVSIALEVDGKGAEIQTDAVLVAVGRIPNTKTLGLEDKGIRTERGSVVVDENFSTNINGVFAIGDCNSKNMLAHAASAQGEAVIDYIMHGRHSYNNQIIPSCIYTKPEIAAVGMTEEAALKSGLDIGIGIFDLHGNGKAMIDGGESGMIKIIADKKLGEVIGVHIIGPHATEMISEACSVMKMEGLVEDIVRTVHPHPTVSESIGEAARAVFGNAIHWPPQ